MQTNGIWTGHFDHIYCFHHTADRERLAAVTRELKRVGILDSGIFSFVYTSPDPWERHIADARKKLWDNSDSANMGFINLGQATARTFREALYLNYGRVLFLEDDVRFMKDMATLARIIEHTPWDRDVIQYDKFMFWEDTAEAFNRRMAENRIDEFFYDPQNEMTPSGACFAANRKAMVGLLMSLEIAGPRPVDGIFHLCNLRRAVATTNAAIQVLYNDAMVNRYAGTDNTHHSCYDEMGIDFTQYAGI